MPANHRRVYLPFATLKRVAGLLDVRQVLPEQLQPLLQSGGTTLVANAVVAGIVAAVIEGSEQAPLAQAWLVCCLVAVACSGVLLMMVKSHFNTKDSLQLASTILTVASAVRGLVWGIGLFLLMPQADSDAQIMLGWVLAGLMCAGAFSSWSHPAAAMAFAGLVGLGGFIGMKGVPGVGESWMPYAVPVMFLLLLRSVLVSTQTLKQRVFAERELASKNDVIGLLLKDFEENASDWLWEADGRGTLKRGAERFARVLELPTESLLSRPLPVLTEIYGAVDAANDVFRAKFNAGEFFSDQVIAFSVGGMDRFLKITARAQRDCGGTIQAWHGVASDVTDERLADLKVRKLALFDTLTDLPNRAFFYDRLAETMALDDRTDSWVMYLDLDGFKAVNDSYGHAAGDQLLRSVSARIASCLPAKGMLARLGGDEFAIVCRGTQKRIQELAARIGTAAAHTFEVNNNDVNVGVSIGISLLTKVEGGCDEVMRRADVALYAAKHQGRGVARFYDGEMDRAQLRRKDLEMALRKALSLELFTVHYQPIVDIKDGKTHSYEALLRLQTPELGRIAPSEFIPVAEETGLIGDIGEWVIRRACADAKRWPDGTCVAVNVSPLQLKSHRILHVVTQALADSGLSPHRLELELTESALVDNVEQTTRILADLKTLGVSLALDDFGTGYSSLSHLHQFNFDKIKIDRSFVQSFGQRRESAAVVNAVVHLARDLGILMTAEGVETAEHMKAMQDVGCDQVQGYLLGKPEPLDSAGAPEDRQTA